MRARFFALVVMLLVVAPLAAGGRSQHFCNMMQRLVSTCCCASAAGPAHAGSRSTFPEIEKPDCCGVVSAGSPASAPALRDSAAGIHVSLLAILASETATVADGAAGILHVESVRARAPPATGPPLYLKNCALLS